MTPANVDTKGRQVVGRFEERIPPGACRHSLAEYAKIQHTQKISGVVTHVKGADKKNQTHITYIYIL